MVNWKCLFLALVTLVVGGCKYDKAALPGVPYVTEPKKVELLDEAGDLALFSGETESDVAFNEAARDAEGNVLNFRNSLFLRERGNDGTARWRLIMTSGGGWKDADGMDEWCKDRAREAQIDFCVLKASLSADRRRIWLVCNPHVGTYNIVCRFDWRENTFAVLTDGDTAVEQPDGTILVEGKKTFLSDENGEPLGAAWYDEWLTPDGQVVRKTKPISADEMQRK